MLRDPSAPWPYPCLFEHTGDHYGSDVTAMLRDKPKQAEHNKVPWYDAVVQDGWKYIRYLRGTDGEELYDLRKDRDLIKNVAADPAYAGTRANMADQLMKTLVEAKDPRVTGDGLTFERAPFIAIQEDPPTKKGGKKGGEKL